MRTIRPEAMSVHDTRKHDKQKKKGGGRRRRGEEGARWSIYKVNTRPAPSVKQLPTGGGNKNDEKSTS